jgi:hypothetical protein
MVVYDCVSSNDADDCIMQLICNSPEVNLTFVKFLGIAMANQGDVAALDTMRSNYVIKARVLNNDIREYKRVLTFFLDVSQPVTLVTTRNHCHHVGDDALNHNYAAVASDLYSKKMAV